MRKARKDSTCHFVLAQRMGGHYLHFSLQVLILDFFKLTITTAQPLEEQNLVPNYRLLSFQQELVPTFLSLTLPRWIFIFIEKKSMEFCSSNWCHSQLNFNGKCVQSSICALQAWAYSYSFKTLMQKPAARGLCNSNCGPFTLAYTSLLGSCSSRHAGRVIQK